MPIPGLPFPDEQLFTSLNCCLPAWLLLMLAPRWRFTMPLVCITASIYAALYVALIAHTIMEGESQVGVGAPDGMPAVGAGPALQHAAPPHMIAG
jgi:hypothetical protein